MGSDTLPRNAPQQAGKPQSPNCRPPCRIAVAAGPERWIAFVVHHKDMAPARVQPSVFTNADAQDIPDKLIGECQRAWPMVLSPTPCEDLRHELPIKNALLQKAAPRQAVALHAEGAIAVVAGKLRLVRREARTRATAELRLAELDLDRHLACPSTKTSSEVGRGSPRVDTLCSSVS